MSIRVRFDINCDGCGRDLDDDDEVYCAPCSECDYDHSRDGRDEVEDFIASNRHDLSRYDIDLLEAVAATMRSGRAVFVHPAQHGIRLGR